MKTERELIKNLEELEGHLQPKQIAKIGADILLKCLDEPGHKDIESELKTWVDRYVQARTYNEKREIFLELHHLETSRLMYECLKETMKREALNIRYIATLIACFRAVPVINDLKRFLIDDIPRVAWENHLKDYPEDAKSLEEIILPFTCEEIEDQLLPLLKGKLEKYEQNLNDSKTWDLLGHPKPKIDSVADLKELVATLKDGN